MHDILLVEDNPDIQAVNKRMLERLGTYNVRLAMSLAQAREMYKKSPPSVMVLDIMLPDGSGLDFLKELRRNDSARPSGVTASVPVLLLSALGTPEDIVAGLKSGGDDYLPKPYDYNVLLARIQALLSRAERIPETISIDAFVFNLISSQAFAYGEDLGLSQKEFGILLLLAQNEGKALNAEHVYEKVWAQPMSGDSQAIQTVISRIRKKIEPIGYGISTLRGKGYVFGSLRT